MSHRFAACVMKVMMNVNIIKIDLKERSQVYLDQIFLDWISDN
jgi:hypothetical protein